MIRVEHNVETGVITEITMTAEEIENRETAAADLLKYKAEAEAAAEAKEAAQAKLAALGLTADDLKALGL
jgi:hypothetical protein